MATIDQDKLPPLDSRALAFDINHEARCTVVDLIRQTEPTTVLGVLLMDSGRKGIPVEAIAERIDQPVGLVSWTIEKLEEEDLCVSLVKDGVVKAMAFAAFTERNE